MQLKFAFQVIIYLYPASNVREVKYTRTKYELVLVEVLGNGGAHFGMSIHKAASDALP